MLESTDTFGKFEFRPLEPGYGITIGNALRRVLLSSLEGFAITSVRIEGVSHEFDTIPGVIESVVDIILNLIEGVSHEFDTIPGVIESVVDIILNLKQVRFKREVKEEESETVSFTVTGKQELTAEDISKNLCNFSVLNPGLHICSMEPTVSIFTPIKNVNYSVEDYRVEQKTDYDKLNLEITTDGSIHPKDALTEAAKILIYHFMLFSDEKISLETPPEKSAPEALDEEALRMRHLLLTKLSDMELSVRALNCLKAADIETFADLVSHQRSELIRFRNFGKKSLNEIDVLMDKMKLNFGMDVTKYNIEVKKKKSEVENNEAQ